MMAKKENGRITVRGRESTRTAKVSFFHGLRDSVVKGIRGSSI